MMKKIIYGLLLSVLCLAGVNAQSVNLYNFNKSTWGTYTVLESATAIDGVPTGADAVAAMVLGAAGETAVTATEDATATSELTGIPFGFDFTYGDKVYDRFAVSTMGFIVLGEKSTGKVSFVPKTRNLQTMNVPAGIGLATELAIYNLAVSYKMESEEAGKHVLAVQFEMNLLQADANPFKYQVRLNEEDNSVTMIFDGLTEIPAADLGKEVIFNIGLKDHKSAKFLKPSWNYDYTSDFYNDCEAWTFTSISKMSSGFECSFTIPEPCAMPIYKKLQDPTISAQTDRMSILFEIDTTGHKDRDDYNSVQYLLVVSEQPITGKPADGTTNLRRDDELLGGTVLSCGGVKQNFGQSSRYPGRECDSMSFEYGRKREPLKANTNYYYALYFYNDEGCVSQFTEPILAQAKTKTMSPDTLYTISKSMTEATFSVKANAAGEDDIAILLTTRKGKDVNDNTICSEGLFGSLPADAVTGGVYANHWSQLYGSETTWYYDTTYVLYVGKVGDNIHCNLPGIVKNNALYFFGAYSKSKETGEYSTVAAQTTPYLTPAVLPFTDNFAQNFASDNLFIGGWAGTTNFEASGSGKTISGVTSTLEAPGEAVLMIPALDFPTDSNVLVNISYSTDYGFTWKEGDSICLEISKDGGKTFEFVKVIHKETERQNQYLNNIVLRDYLGAKQAVLRVRVKAAAGDKLLNAEVTKINITALPFCPEPGKPSVSSTRVYGGTLGLTWTASVNNETQWNISTAAAVAEGQEPAWSRPVLVEQQPYYLTGLADQEVYNVRIQAVCEGGRTSGWVEAQVQAGRVPSFTEDFDHLEFEEDYYGELQPQLPARWRSGYHYISSWSGPSTSWGSGKEKFYQYKTKEAITAESTGYNGSLAFDMQHASGYVHLIQTPMVELNPSEKPQLKFDAAFGSWVNDEFVAMPADNQKDTMRLALWVCDSGNFNIKNVPAKEWKVTELATWNAGKAFTVDLSEFVTEAKVVSVVMAIFTEKATANETNMLYLDNIGIVNTEPLARSVKVAALGAEEATIQWVADKNVEKWLVKLEGGSLTAPRFFTDVVGNTQVIDGLEAEQTYTASVTPAGNGQEAAAERWVSVRFTTLAASCPEPTALAVSNVEQRTAVLSWQGEAAEGYFVRYRPVAAQGSEALPWIEVRVKEGTTYTLSGLTPGTAYECEVQGVCSEVAEFYSEWVALEGGFETKAITCFAPTELRCPEATLTHKSAQVSWTGTSAGYQVAWTEQGSNAWTYSEVVSEAAYTIKGLDYNSWYTFKVRGVCAAGDSSDWSETRNFRTLARPACANPTNLRVESLTQTSADLKWDYAEADEGDLASFTLRHREASVQAWDSIKEVEGTTYAITDMKPKTAYIWNVMAICQDDRSSEWLNLRFTTLDQDTVPTTPPTDTTAIEDLKLATGLYVAASQGQIHVMNPKSVRIDNIRIYGLNGQRLEQYAIRSTDHVILTTAVRQRVAIVEVESAGRFIRFKVMLP